MEELVVGGISVGKDNIFSLYFARQLVDFLFHVLIARRCFPTMRSCFLTLLFVQLGTASSVIGSLQSKVIENSDVIVEKIKEYQKNSCLHGLYSKAIGIVDDPDIERNILEIVRARGYPIENHCVQTPDGYVLTLQRMPRGLQPPGNKRGVKKDVIVFAHGLMSASDSYVLQGPGKSLAYIMADAGYDVWLLNFRGNPYAMWHVNYTTDDPEFYDFCVDQLAEIDMPVCIDYVMKKTGCKQVFIIGESLGTAVVYAMLAARPEYNKKVELVLNMSPVAYCPNMKYTTRLLCLLLNELDKVQGPMKLPPKSEFGSLLKLAVCNNVFKEFTCEPNFALVGAKPYYLNKTQLGVIITHFPCETSTRLIAHFGQWIKSDRFCKYDYGKEENLIRHKQDTPPSYDLGKVTAPVALLWSKKDMLSHPADIDRTRKELPNVVEDFCVPDENFDHLDFACAYNACELVYPEMLAMMERAKRRRKH